MINPLNAIFWSGCCRMNPPFLLLELAMESKTLPFGAYQKRRSFWHNADKGFWFPIIVVLALLLFFSCSTDTFLTLRNFTAVSGQVGMLLIACLGGTFIILMGSIDLSIGALVLLNGALSVTLLNNTGAGFWVLPLMIIAGG